MSTPHPMFSAMVLRDNLGLTTVRGGPVRVSIVRPEGGARLAVVPPTGAAEKEFFAVWSTTTGLWKVRPSAVSKAKPEVVTDREMGLRLHRVFAAVTAATAAQ